MKTLIKEVMTPNPKTISINGSLHEAEELFRKKRLRHLPVVDGMNLKGMVSKTDLMRMCFADTFGDQEEEIDETLLSDMTLQDIMKSPVITVTEETTICDAAEILEENEIHAMPVLKDDELVGIVTTTDIIRHFIRQKQVLMEKEENSYKAN